MAKVIRVKYNQFPPAFGLVLAALALGACQPAAPAVAIVLDSYHAEIKLVYANSGVILLEPADLSELTHPGSSLLAILPGSLNTGRAAALAAGLKWVVLDPRISEDDPLTPGSAHELAAAIEDLRRLGFSPLVVLRDQEQSTGFMQWAGFSGAEVLATTAGGAVSEIRPRLATGGKLFVIVPDPLLFSEIYSSLERPSDSDTGNILYAGGGAWYAGLYDPRIRYALLPDFAELGSEAFIAEIPTLRNGQLVSARGAILAKPNKIN